MNEGNFLGKQPALNGYIRLMPANSAEINKLCIHLSLR